ncbi:hypothetical protein HMPREF3226_01346 [Prevotella corporis]|uniref:Uncharacterized protein n=1 Tax=Prevotella corporis TaxID=28128 RepID=A0A133Q9E3_9BACT|nr:hypothetical protein HMPREF3226_01346 [Prevotella corporis]
MDKKYFYTCVFIVGSQRFVLNLIHDVIRPLVLTSRISFH